MLLERAKTERTIELNQKTITRIELKPIIHKVHEYIQTLDEPIQFLLRNNTPIKHILVDPELFECFLILNLWEISKSRQAVENMIALTIADTHLQYAYADDRATEEKPLTLPALAFLFSTDITDQ